MKKITSIAIISILCLSTQCNNKSVRAYRIIERTESNNTFGLIDYTGKTLYPHCFDDITADEKIECYIKGFGYAYLPEDNIIKCINISKAYIYQLPDDKSKIIHSLESPYVLEILDVEKNHINKKKLFNFSLYPTIPLSNTVLGDRSLSYDVDFDYRWIKVKNGKIIGWISSEFLCLDYIITDSYIYWCRMVYPDGIVNPYEIGVVNTKNNKNKIIQLDASSVVISGKYAVYNIDGESGIDSLYIYSLPDFNFVFQCKHTSSDYKGKMELNNNWIIIRKINESTIRNIPNSEMYTFEWEEIMLIDGKLIKTGVRGKE